MPESSTPSHNDARPILIRIVSVIVCPWQQAASHEAASGKIRYVRRDHQRCCHCVSARLARWIADFVQPAQSTYVIRRENSECGVGAAGGSRCGRRRAGVDRHSMQRTGALHNAMSAAVAPPMTTQSVYPSHGTRRRSFMNSPVSRLIDIQRLAGGR